MEWETFLNLRPDTPLDWRVHVTPSDQYTGAFSDSTKWRSLKLTYPNSDSIAYAWYAADHADAKALSQLMQTGPERALILNLAFEGNGDRQLKVLKLANDTWIVP